MLAAYKALDFVFQWGNLTLSMGVVLQYVNMIFEISNPSLFLSHPKDSQKSKVN